MNYTIKTIIEFTLESGRKARIEYDPETTVGRVVVLDGVNAKLYINDEFINFKGDPFTLYYKPEFMVADVQNLEDIGALDDCL